MVRLATISDLGVLYDLVLEMHAATKYPRLDPPVMVHEETARSLLMTAVSGNGRTNNGGSLVLLAERDGKPVGFMIGVLDRVYHIGNRLRANDMYLFCRSGEAGSSVVRLVDKYIEWASANPKVAEIFLSYTDVGGIDGEKIAALFKRKGFNRCGEIFERAGQ